MLFFFSQSNRIFRGGGGVLSSSESTAFFSHTHLVATSGRFSQTCLNYLDTIYLFFFPLQKQVPPHQRATLLGLVNALPACDLFRRFSLNPDSSIPPRAVICLGRCVPYNEAVRSGWGFLFSQKHTIESASFEKKARFILFPPEFPALL